MKNTKKIILTTVLATSVLGVPTNSIKAAEDEVVTSPTSEVQPPVVDDKPVVPETPKDDKDRGGAVEVDKEKEQDKPVVPETPKDDRDNGGAVEVDKQAEKDKNDIIVNKQDNTQNLDQFNKVVDVTKNKQELQGVITNTNKLTSEQKQELSQELDKAKTDEEINKVKELAKTGIDNSGTVTLFSSLLGVLGLALAGFLKKVRQ